MSLHSEPILLQLAQHWESKYGHLKLVLLVVRDQEKIILFRYKEANSKEYQQCCFLENLPQKGSNY